MALTLVVEDGTGLSTANVYDDEADTETYLTDEEGLTAFAALATTELKKRCLLRMTRLVERLVTDRVNGVPLQSDQTMLFPRYGAFSTRINFESDERPLDYRHGIMVFADHEAQALQQGRRVSLLDRRNNFFQVRDGKGILQRNRNHQLLVWDRYPDAWDLISTAYPPGLRQLRA